MFYTNANKYAAWAAVVTNEVKHPVRTTYNGGLLMWSEGRNTFIAATRNLPEEAIQGARFGLDGDWIPHMWDWDFRRELGCE